MRKTVRSHRKARTNSNLIKFQVLNVLGLTTEELDILKIIIREKMTNESTDDIYTVVRSV